MFMRVRARGQVAVDRWPRAWTGGHFRFETYIYIYICIHVDTYRVTSIKCVYYMSISLITYIYIYIYIL